MSQQRESHRACASNRFDQRYIILIQNIPLHCQWQELKDVARSLGGRQILKADVFAVGNGTKMGHCTIKGRSDAVKVYRNLLGYGWNGHRVRVKLFALGEDGSLRLVEGLEESNLIADAARTPPLARSASHDDTPMTTHASQPLYTDPSDLSASIGYNSQFEAMPSWSPQPAIPAAASTTTLLPSYPSSVCPPQHPYLPTSTHATTFAPPTHHSTWYSPDNTWYSPDNTWYPPKPMPPPMSSTPPLPVCPANAGDTIFLSGLPDCQSEIEVRGLLKRRGNVLYLEIHLDSCNPGENKGRSTTSSQNTTRDSSQGSSDRSSGSSSRSGPLVVNGARHASYRRGRAGKRSARESGGSSEEDDDSDSDHDSSSDEEERRRRRSGARSKSPASVPEPINPSCHFPQGFLNPD